MASFYWLRRNYCKTNYKRNVTLCSAKKMHCTQCCHNHCESGMLEPHVQWVQLPFALCIQKFLGAMRVQAEGATDTRSAEIT